MMLRGILIGVSAGALLLLTGCGHKPEAVRAPVTVTVTSTVTTPVPTTVQVTTTVTAAPNVPLTTSGLSFGDKVYDHTKVEAGVTNILTSAPPAGYGLSGVTGVSCPSDVRVLAGGTFNCTATIGGTTKSILITIEDSDGKYQVGVPN